MEHETFEKIEQTTKKAFYIFLWLCLAVYILSWFWNVISMILLPYPQEYRDMVTMQLTDCFSRGVNAYSYSNSPPFFYLYGFLFSFCLSPFARLHWIGLIPLHKIAVMVCILITASLVALEVKKNTKSTLLQVLGFSLALVTSWNTVNFIVRPDSFGLLIVSIIPFLIRRKRNWPAIIFAAFLTIAAFYAKQYFLFIAAPVFLYLLVVDRRKSLLYFAATIIFMVVSFVIVKYALPAYLYAVLIAQANSIGGSVSYLIKQTTDFFKLTWQVGLLTVFSLVLFFKRLPEIRSSRGRGERLLGSLDFDRDVGGFIYYFVLFIGCCCLLVLGQVTGARFSYYFQLIFPSMIILGISSISKIKRQLIQRIVVLVVLLVSAFNFHMNFNTVFDASEKKSWEKAYAVLDTYKSDSMLLAPYFADYVFRNDLDIVDNGNTEYFSNLIRTDRDLLTMRALKVILPNADQQVDRYDQWQRKISENVRDKRYSVIAYGKGYPLFFSQGELEKNYFVADEIELHLPGEVWHTEFWIPKSDTARIE